jgi:hypothetical protein
MEELGHAICHAARCCQGHRELATPRTCWSRDERCWYSDWQRAGGPRCLSSSPLRSTIYTPPCRPDGLWSPPNLLSNGYREIFSRGKAAGA